MQRAGASQSYRTVTQITCSMQPMQSASQVDLGFGVIEFKFKIQKYQFYQWVVGKNEYA